MIDKKTYNEMKRLIFEYENQSKSSISEQQPYIMVETIDTEAKYNPNYGDERICECGHPYYRHFDTYDNMWAVGCKYCECMTFKEK